MDGVKRKGILLAAGRNSRLYPCTLAAPKSLLPVYDKPLIYYSMSSLMFAGAREVLVIATPEMQAMHKRLLGGGEQFGMKISYAAQDTPRGIADAFFVAEEFLAGAPSALALADNIFYGGDLPHSLRAAAAAKDGAVVFAVAVKDPRRFGVAEFCKDGRALSIEEKPQKPKSNFAVTGLYFYDEKVLDYARQLRPSARGELEITDLNRLYLQAGALNVRRLGRGIAWFDTGTADSLAEAAGFIRTVQSQQGLMVCCPEEIAYYNGWIGREQLLLQSEKIQNTSYGDYLRYLAEGAKSGAEGAAEGKK